MRCPKCHVLMDLKAQWPGRLAEGTYPAECVTLFQCPECKNVEVKID